MQSVLARNPKGYRKKTVFWDKKFSTMFKKFWKNKICWWRKFKLLFRLRNCSELQRMYVLYKMLSKMTYEVGGMYWSFGKECRLRFLFNRIRYHNRIKSAHSFSYYGTAYDLLGIILRYGLFLTCMLAYISMELSMTFMLSKITIWEFPWFPCFL